MVAPLHSWTLDPNEAMQVQKQMRERLVLEWDEREIHTVGGVDIGLGENEARAAIVVLRFPELDLIESVTASAPLVFPYIPGLLAFREGPAFLAAWEKLEHKPELVMFDGQGIAHPRGVGIASLMGLWVDRPTIGVAKSRLYGRHEEPGTEAGSSVPLIDPYNPKRVIGAVARSKVKTKPLYISPGHRIDVNHAVEFVLRCLKGYRLPETTRLAHQTASKKI